MKKIRSINDVITNSSDETYIVKSDLTVNEMLDLLKQYKNPNETCSGMGGILEVYSNKGNSNGAKYGNIGPELPDGFLAICIDNGFQSIKDYVENNFGACSENSEDARIISDIVAFKSLGEEFDKFSLQYKYKKENIKYPELLDILHEEMVNAFYKLKNKI